MRQHKLKIATVLLMALAACTKPALINETQEVPSGDWEFNDVKRFTHEVSDTLSPFNFYAQIRHSGNYEYQNLIIYFKTYFPNNTFIVDTIDCPMAEASGKWMGSGLGDLLDNQVMFKRNLQFPLAGTYNFEIQHAMRPDTIHEIYDVGLLIKNAYD
jgi:gliding motility-associated lipoprotein GldH